MPLDLGSFQPSPAEAAALRRLEQSFGAGWRSAAAWRIAVAVSGTRVGLVFTGSSACTMVASVPVATTETRIVPVMSGSKVAPRMMLASESTSSRMRLAASSTS